MVEQSTAIGFPGLLLQVFGLSKIKMRQLVTRLHGPNIGNLDSAVLGGIRAW
jgi:hypothetical protein